MTYKLNIKYSARCFSAIHGIIGERKRLQPNIHTARMRTVHSRGEWNNV